MQVTLFRKASVGALVLGVAVWTGAAGVFAQTDMSNGNPQPQASAPAQDYQVQQVASGKKMTVKGILIAREDEQTFVVRDDAGNYTRVMLSPDASIKSKGGFLSSGRKYEHASLVRGLNLEAEGRGNDQGQLVASKVRFSTTDYRVAQSLEARVDPVETRVSGAEGRLSQVEDNARRTSGQIEELMAVSNAARGGAKAAQDTADAAVAGVRATNERIGEIDNYKPTETATINFKTGSAVLSPEAKTQLDDLATKVQPLHGYMIEVTGYADSTGSVARNRSLSQRRAEAVTRYLLEQHQVPLRRIIPSYGYGENNSVADNTTREGRAQNRRVEVSVLVSNGLTQAAPEMSVPQPAASDTTTPPPDQQ